MSMQDQVADMLCRIRNAQMAGHASTSCAGSKLKRGILDVLQNEGYIQSYEASMDHNKQTLTINLKYYADTTQKNVILPVINKIERVSRPGKRVYSQYANLPKYFAGLGVVVVSTSQGVMSNRQIASEFKKNGKKLGGEVLFVVL